MVTQNKQHGNPNITQYGHETRFKPGQSGNPAGPPKAKVQFWRYVQQYSEMTDAEIEKVDKANLRQSQHAAMKFIEDMVAGNWQQVKEALDRDEGAILKRQETKLDSDQPSTLIINMPGGSKADSRSGSGFQSKY